VTRLRALSAVAGAGVIALALALAGPALGRHHRPHRPPKPLPRALSVDEKEWSLTPSQKVLHAGTVTFHDYNRGMDPHNLEVIGPSGPVQTISVAPGTSGTLTAHLPPGTYHLVCSLYAGTPQSHEALGMHAVITVR
jgi:plastocyanin